jgi:adenosine deaminase CECR1
MARNIQAFSEEGVSYMEIQVGVQSARSAEGAEISPDEAAAILRARLEQKDVLATGMTVRFQVPLLRFAPNAEEHLREIYKFVYDNSDLFVAVNMVGREDNDKGHPRRFLSTLREMRQQYGGVKLSIHAGEVDEPNAHVRETLLLGADRIGHGLNLITDDDTMRLMRHGPYLVETNLISNLLLGYIQDYSQHPFPEYLRTGVPVALSTDDRGMWDSTLTDEFFVATTEYNLSWDEIKLLSRNSLSHAFVPPAVKQTLLEKYDARIAQFERRMRKSGVEILDAMPATRRFVCTRYELCY